MNKFLILSLSVLMAAPAFGADVAARMSCEDIALEISTLSALEEPTEEDLARLDNMRAQQRRSCTKTAGARRTNGARMVTAASLAKKADEVTAIAAATTTEVATTTATTAATDESSVQAKKQEYCRDLWNTIGQLKLDKADQEKIAQMQAQYDNDCEEKKVAAETEQDAEAAAIAEAERINALIDAGFCADGTKPNKYGCCTGEKFTDMGDLVFACCPEDGGLCFPPMNNGSAI